jgi:UPF0755 protein
MPKNYNDDLLSDIPTVDDIDKGSRDIMDYKKSRGDEDMKIASKGGRPARQTSGRPTGSRPTSGRPSQNRPSSGRPSSSQYRRTGASQNRSQNQRRRTPPVVEKAKGAGCLGKIIYLAVILAISIVLSVFAVNVSCDVFGIFQEDSSVSITIPEKISAEELTDLLHEKNIVQYKWAFNLMQKLKKVKTYDGGIEIVLNRKSDYSTIIRKIRYSDIEREVVSVTFPEGYNLDKVLELLEENKVCSASDMKAQMNDVEFDYKFMNEMSNNPDILYKYEGYLFPDTYDFYVGDTPQSVYNKFLSNMEKKLKDKYYARANELGMSMHDVITLASMIQKESSKTAEMKTVSSVFHNRLKINKKLQSDVTVWYPYYKKEDVPADILPTFSSKYNTYNIEGLPPGPICNPGLDAIEAALYPAETNYYYFVTDANGAYYYAVTFEEHQRNCATALTKGAIGGIETE